MPIIFTTSMWSISFFRIHIFHQSWLKGKNKIKKLEIRKYIFKSKILKFIIPTANSIFGCYNPVGVKLLTRLQLRLSHLRKHKFKHNFQDTLIFQLWKTDWNCFSFSLFMSQLLWQMINPPEQNQKYQS